MEVNDKLLDFLHQIVYNIWCKGGDVMSMCYKENIINRIDNLGSRDVFIADDFLDISGYETVRSALNRLVKSGDIKRVMKGFYFKPKYYEILDDYSSPSADEFAKAIARKYNWTIAPSGNTALNMLGLDTQVPAKWTYISDGRYATFPFGNTAIEFKHTSNGMVSNMSTLSAMVVQAIKAIGKDNIMDRQVVHLSTLLTDKQKNTLLKETTTVTKWIYQIVRRICGVSDV